MIGRIRSLLGGPKASTTVGNLIGVLGGGAWPTDGMSSVAGKTVTAETALQHAAVWACAQRTAQLVATMPCHVIEKSKDGRRREIEPDIADVVTRQPNQMQTNVEFWEGMTAHQTLRGNAYAEKLYMGKNIVGLRPLLKCQPRRDGAGWIYDDYAEGKKRTLPADKVFHLRGFGAGDGLGMSAIRYGAHSIGAALAADETAGSIFSNRMMAGGVLSSKQTLTSDQRASLTDMLANFMGSKKAGKTLVLEAGLTHSPIQMNPEDAQLLATRQFSVEDICRWFGIPPVIIGHASSGQTMWGSGVEAIMLAWLTTGINPLLRRMEARMDRDLIPVEKRKVWNFKFNREAMLQMDSQAKAEFLMKLRFAGIITGDESREFIDLEPRGGVSDELFIQSSMETLAALGKGNNDGQN